MISLRMTYFEIIDTDYTAVLAEIWVNGQRAGTFSNLSAAKLRERAKPIYANQAEEFTFSKIDEARSFLASSRSYTEILEGEFHPLRPLEEA